MSKAQPWKLSPQDLPQNPLHCSWLSQCYQNLPQVSEVQAGFSSSLRKSLERGRGLWLPRDGAWWCWCMYLSTSPMLGSPCSNWLHF